MAIATSLPKNNLTIRFPPPSNPTIQEETYQLLELPSEILNRVESSSSSRPFPTFLLRTVSISNSLVILRTPTSNPIPPLTSVPTSSSTSTSTATAIGTSPASESRPTLEIRDVCHEVLECVPQAANLERIRTVLRPTQWEGLGKRTRAVELGSTNKARRWTKAQLESVVQASQVELDAGLRERNVVQFNGKMMMLPPKELAPLLCLMLTLLTIHAPSTTQAKVEAPLRPLLQALEVDHDVPSELSSAVMDLFGEVESGAQLWRADVSRMVAEVGRGLLAVLNPSGNTGSQGRSLDAFISEWREQVGETWQESTELKLLEGDFLLNLPLSTTSHLGATIVPFSNHSLPLHPATRFADLFLTRPRWRPDEMAPFLRGLTRDGDTKERDKLVAKFVRVVKEKGGVWWYPRRTS